MTPENAELLARYAGHLERSPLTGHSPRTYLGAVLADLAWLRDAPAGGDPLNDPMAKDRAVRDCRSCLERSTSRYGGADQVSLLKVRNDRTPPLVTCLDVLALDENPPDPVLLNCDSHHLVRFGRQVVILAAPGTDSADSNDGFRVPERAVISGRIRLRGGGPGSAQRLPDLLRDDRGRVLAGDYREKRGNRVLFAGPSSSGSGSVFLLAAACLIQSSAAA